VSPIVEEPGGGAWFSYREMTAAVDRAFAVPKDQPLPVRQMLSELLASRVPQPAPEPEM
jgi:hypothetical protein